MEKVALLIIEFEKFTNFKHYNIDQIKAEINEEKQKKKELQEKILEWERKLRSTRRDVGGSNAGANFASHSKKREKVLEYRLDYVIIE